MTISPGGEQKQNYHAAKLSWILAMQYKAAGARKLNKKLLQWVFNVYSVAVNVLWKETAFSRQMTMKTWSGSFIGEMYFYKVSWWPWCPPPLLTWHVLFCPYRPYVYLTSANKIMMMTMMGITKSPNFPMPLAHGGVSPPQTTNSAWMPSSGAVYRIYVTEFLFSRHQPRWYHRYSSR